MDWPDLTHKIGVAGCWVLILLLFFQFVGRVWRDIQEQADRDSRELMREVQRHYEGREGLRER